MEALASLDFATAPRIVIKPGALQELAGHVQALGLRRLFLVTDIGIARVGILAPVLSHLEGAGIAVTVFDAVEADPSETTVESAARQAQQSGCEGVLGLGGGSPMDVAKLVACLACSGAATLAPLYGIEQVTLPRLPLLLAPTTAGTGSEVTPIAIVTTPTQEKKGVVSRRLLPDLALLDPLATLGLPSGVTAATGVDAMVHAVEAFTSRHRKNLLSDMLAQQALGMLHAALPEVLVNPRNVEARSRMLLGSCLAGMAFANAPVAAVHALAYPLGSHFHLPHGLSNALMLLPVLEMNLPVAAEAYAQLAACIGPTSGSAEARAAQFMQSMRILLERSGLPRTLGQAGVPAGQIELLSTEAMKQTRLLVNNPVELGLDDVRRIYRRAETGR